MLSGGFLSGGEWCIGDYCTSWSIIGEAVTDVAKATYDNVIEPVGSGIATAAVSTYDFFDTVSSNEFWNYYTSEPSRAWSALTGWYGDSAHPEKKLLAFLPFAPLAFIYGIPAFATATAGTGIFGSLLFGGSGAGCTIHVGNSRTSIGPYNGPCSSEWLDIYRRGQQDCENNGGHVRIISNVSTSNQCNMSYECE